MKKLSNKLACTLATVMTVAMGVSSPAFAGDANSFMETARSSLTRSADPFVNLVLVVIGLVGVVFVVINAVKYFKEDRESETSLFRVGIGIILSVIIIFVIKETFLKV